MGINKLGELLGFVVGVFILTCAELIIPFLALYWTGHFFQYICLTLFILTYLANIGMFTYTVIKREVMKLNG